LGHNVQPAATAAGSDRLFTNLYIVSRTAAALLASNLRKLNYFPQGDIMKKLMFLAAAVCLMAVAAFAQDKKAANFSGTWTLDVSKSKLGNAPTTIESQTLTVTQTDKDLKVEQVTKRTAPPAGGGGGGGGRMGGMMGGDGTNTYTLDGKEAKSEITTPMGSMAVATTAKLDGGKFVLTRTVNTPNGARTSSESWELSSDGKTLTITATRPTRDGGTDTTTKVFTKS
jgi:hypothetical protein